MARKAREGEGAMKAEAAEFGKPIDSPRIQTRFWSVIVEGDLRK